MAQHFQLVQFLDGEFHSHLFGPEADIFAAMEIRGYPFADKLGAAHLRPELAGQPVFKGLAGPMWGGHAADGQPIVRYEDANACNILSS